MGKKEETKNVQTDRKQKAPRTYYFDRWFGGEDEVKNIKNLIRVIEWLLYGLILFVCGLFFVEQWELCLGAGHEMRFFFVLLTVLGLSAAETGVMLFSNNEPVRKVMPLMEAITTCLTVVLSSSTYSLVLYLLVSTRFYFATDRLRASLWLFGIGLSLFVLSYVMHVYFISGDITNIGILREIFGSVMAIGIHYLAAQFVLSFYWQYLQLNKALEELDKNKKEMEKSYEALVKVAALEERQRIAKELHDTAGHSLTTVIMQTEAAKRVIDTNAEEAKNKIISANLQAKHTLERLRESVHLLSGASDTVSLKMELEQTISETTDGTGIYIRSMVEDVVLSREKHRFIVRAFKEGLSNGIRHGEATAFWFELKTENNNLHFYLSDNGKGLEGKAFQEGFGLLSMSDRVKDFGGQISFFSEEDEGFEISFTIPINTDNKQEK